VDLDLAGRRVLVTGASQGIGEGLARAFAEEGCDLFLVARNADKLAAVAGRLRSDCGVSVEVLALDLTDASAMEQLAAFDGIDVLVNNAGAIPGGDLQTVGSAAWRQAWDLKVYGYINLCRQFYARMKQQGGGVILNNIGASAEFFDPAYIAGSTGNAALVAFTRALGARSLDDAIRVVGVSPGPVATDRIERLMNERLKASGEERPAGSPFPLGRPATVKEIADLFVFLASPRSAYTSGVVFTVDGGLSARHAP
jgi:NAD(P)-dependent dehydrogenase (short-subunit alcohol dehydrogenase family)